MPLAGLGAPSKVVATLFYQALPPYYLQDVYTHGKGQETQRLFFLTSHLNFGSVRFLGYHSG